MSKLAVGASVFLATAALAGVPAGGVSAKTKPKPKPATAWDCTVLMPAATFGSLSGTTVSLTGVFKSAANATSVCHYGNDLVTIGAGTTRKAAGSFNYAHWIAGATQSTQREAATCTTPPVTDLRDCKLTPLSGFGKQAAEFNRSVVVLTVGATFVQVYSQDRTLSYDQLEAVAGALLAKLK